MVTVDKSDILGSVSLEGIKEQLKIRSLYDIEER
jgi:hypothetical protein